MSLGYNSSSPISCDLRASYLNLSKLHFLHI